MPVAHVRHIYFIIIIIRILINRVSRLLGRATTADAGSSTNDRKILTLSKQTDNSKQVSSFLFPSYRRVASFSLGFFNKKKTNKNKNALKKGFERVEKSEGKRKTNHEGEFRARKEMIKWKRKGKRERRVMFKRGFK